MIIMDVCTALNASGLEAAAKIKKTIQRYGLLLLPASVPLYHGPHHEWGIGVSGYNTTSEVGEALNTEFTEAELRVLRELTSGDTMKKLQAV